MNVQPRFRAVIFDLDGVLLDTEGLYQAATEQVLSRYERTLDLDVWSSQVGRPSAVVAGNIARAHDVPISETDFHEEREVILRELLRHAVPMPGAEQLTRDLKAHRIPVGVATSSDRDIFELKTAVYSDWFALFDCLVNRDDVEHGKPSPDLFLRAAQLLGVEPSACLVFEDAPSGIEAAEAAGMAVVATPSVPLPAPLPAAVIQVLASLEHFDIASSGLAIPGASAGP